MTEPLDNPPAGALPLAEALALFSPPDLWSDYLRKSAVRRGVPRDAAYNKERKPLQADLNRLLRRIKQTVVDRLIAGELIGFGQEAPPFGPWRRIPAAAWRTLKLADIRKGVARGSDIELGGLHILEAGPANSSSIRRDRIGRPSDFPTIEAEFDRRIKAGDIAGSLNQQAHILADWYAITYPHHRPYRPSTIRNRLREKYREAVRTIA